MDAQELEKLFDLKEKGIITEEEFNQKKKDFFEQSKISNSNKIKILDNYLYCFQNSFNLSGRASRSEFWYFILVNAIIGFLLGAISGIISYVNNSNFLILVQIFQILQIAPGYGVVVRRFHDLDMDSGWGALYIIPTILTLMTTFNPNYPEEFIIFSGIVNLICAALLVVFMCIRGDEKENRFGMPK